MYRNGIWIKYRIYTFSVCTDSYARHFFSAHSLVYLYSGQLHLLNQCGEALTVGQGECAFIGRDNYSRLYAEPDREAPCRMAFFSLTRQFLCEFYQTLDPACREAFSESLVGFASAAAQTENRKFLPLAAPLYPERSGALGRGASIEDDRDHLYPAGYGQTICSDPVRFQWHMRNESARPVTKRGGC